MNKTLEVDSIMNKDPIACRIAEQWIDYHSRRREWLNAKTEIREYIFATDTRHTSNSKLPWKNSTTIPKLCQIRDNLYANYTLTLFSRDKNIHWRANDKDSASVEKRDAIVNYMLWVMDQPSFKHEMDKLILDYIDYGNCFVTAEWVDQRVQHADKSQVGYVGPAVRRINPMDIVFNPTAERFEDTPKIIRSVVSQGDLKEYLGRLTTDQNREAYEGLWKYLKEVRQTAHEFTGDWIERDTMYQVDGFTSFRDYLQSNYCEVLTFYGDMYDAEKDEVHKNQMITIVDRHKVIDMRPNPSYFGYPPIFHSAWRKRQDNLWGMGPLDNLVGMQYRIDHIENMKADIFDLVTFPVQKIKGFVEDYTWQPGEKIYVSEEGDVELVTPDVNVLQANVEIANLQQQMEEMAGAPREAMGFRTPGEKTKYEVQALENAAARIFQNKIRQFEEQVVEPILNAMLELARRNMTGVNVIEVFDDEFKVSSFNSLTVEDITGIGRIRPMAARHFAEQAQLIQNISSLTQSALWQTIQPHFSSIRLAELTEEALDLRDHELVTPFIALSEQADAQKHQMALEEQVAMTTNTPSGIGADYDPEELAAIGNNTQEPPV